MDVEILHRRLVHVTIFLDRSDQFGDTRRARFDLTRELRGCELAIHSRENVDDRRPWYLAEKFIQSGGVHAGFDEIRREFPRLFHTMRVEPLGEFILAIALIE